LIAVIATIRRFTTVRVFGVRSARYALRSRGLPPIIIIIGRSDNNAVTPGTHVLAPFRLCATGPQRPTPRRRLTARLSEFGPLSVQTPSGNLPKR